MLLKIGELAKHTGLTVRALHHYDAIGLLTPSARSDAGYRLYNRTDIARLHHIQALRKFGMSLAEIGAYLARPDLPLATVVAQQIAMLTRQIDQANTLRARLSDLHQQLTQGQEPELADWLTTLELMTMYDKYFSKDELKQLPLYNATAAVNAEWAALVESVRALMDSGAGPDHPQAQALANQWMTMVVRDTAANPVLFAKLNTMHEQEPVMQNKTGITPALMQFVIAASGQHKLSIYRKYLSDEEFTFLRANIGKRASEWPSLIAQVQSAMDKGCAPNAPEVQVLARHWFELFRSFAGDNPSTQQKIRDALTNEPGLTNAGFVTAAMRDFMRAAMASLRPH
ncbi:MerR family transcriptional regulator [Rugamonas apoptosis]|uniref:MerR family transcriptional regulator n=1 Tax=Rugamonas apoptosis TaxID=2758570 RepID=A0A7W2FCN2_9BURK|nr:MerR family transcriptional regulator [Rugamonas apoptosis]MBA5689225.1 MerR family transcriptional regulator [Rugamonas apoptosis]